MNDRKHVKGLTERFSALHKLNARRRKRRIPVVHGLASTDCGAACLSMVLEYYGKPVRLDELREVTATGRDGVSALSILEAGRAYGLRGRGLRVELEDLPFLPIGSILHWDLAHFVVLERVGKKEVHVVDPAFGRRQLTMEEFGKSFTGVALTFEPSDDFEQEGDRRRGSWRYFRRVLQQSNVVSKLFITSVVIQLFLLSTPVLTTVIVDRIVPRGDTHLLNVLTFGFITIIAFHLLAQIVRVHLLLHLRTHLDLQMTFGFLEHLVQLPYSFFQRRSSGDLMMRLNSNANMREILTTTTMSAILDGPLVVLYLALLVIFSVKLGLLVLGLGVLQILVYLLARRVYHRLMAKELHARAQADAYMVEILTGIETIKSIGAEHRSVDRWSNLFVDHQNVTISRGRAAAVVDSLMSMMQMGSPLVVLLFGASLVLSGELSLGSMLGLTALSTGFLMPLGKLVGTALELQLLKGYVERIDDVFDTEPEEHHDQVVGAEPLTGQVTLERVSFRYSSQAPLAVRDVSIDVEPGQCIAIVGRSGAGKSTLARLVIGLHRPVSGRTLFDGVDLTTLSANSVRRQIGIVPQVPFLFGGTIRENILIADPTIPLERAVEAAKLAAIHDEIIDMPMGYNTVIGDAGNALSAGQRQRIALARALVLKPPILLLDEATSALDSVAEQIIQRNLESLHSTRIIIAHRLSTITDADVILVMDQGAIVERGGHEELLAKDSVYRELVSAQL